VNSQKTWKRGGFYINGKGGKNLKRGRGGRGGLTGEKVALTMKQKFLLGGSE